MREKVHLGLAGHQAGRRRDVGRLPGHSPVQRRQSASTPSSGGARGCTASRSVGCGAGWWINHHRDDDVPRDGDDVPARAGGGGVDGTRCLTPRTDALGVGDHGCSSARNCRASPCRPTGRVRLLLAGLRVRYDPARVFGPLCRQDSRGDVRQLVEDSWCWHEHVQSPTSSARMVTCRATPPACGPSYRGSGARRGS